jgi:hypothetical protein
VLFRSFCADHAIDGELDRVESTLLAPQFVPRLAGGARAVSSGALVELAPRGEQLVRRARFVVAPAYLRGVLAAFRRLAWGETVTWDRRAHRGTVAVVPEVPAFILRRFQCHGDYVLERAGARRTRRRVELALVVAAPGVGPAVEARLAALLGDLFDDEARLLAASVA